MRKFCCFLTVLLLALPAMAAMPATGRGRAAARNTNDNARAGTLVSAPATASANRNKTDGAQNNTETQQPAETSQVADIQQVAQVNTYERDKAACIQNNIGVGDTFVWASRYSSAQDYVSLIEDVKKPENNVCFVKVSLSSADARIDVSDIADKYFLMGDTITCGEWADEAMLKQRILDAKKKGRTWATVGAAVGGAGLGVGAMELFGNKLLAKAGVSSVEGQDGLDETDLLCSQLKVLQKEDKAEYDNIKQHLQTLSDKCENTNWTDEVKKPEDCGKYDYKILLDC